MNGKVRVTIVLEFPKKKNFEMDPAVDEMYDRVMNDLGFEPKDLSAINIEVLDEDDMVIESSENLYMGEYD